MTLDEYPNRDGKKVWLSQDEVDQLPEVTDDAMVVLDWGGAIDLETFLDHNRGTHTTEAQRRERGKVEWLLDM